MMLNLVEQTLGTISHLQPSLNLVAVYADEDAATVLVRWYLREHVVPVSLESAQRILARARRDQAITGSEGYDDDPTATIYWLRQNEYVSLLHPTEKEAVSNFQANVGPRCRQYELPRRRSLVSGRFRR